MAFVRIIENWVDEVGAWMDRLESVGPSQVRPWLAHETEDYHRELSTHLQIDPESSIDEILEELWRRIRIADDERRERTWKMIDEAKKRGELE
jgi:hypothetical protein